MVLHYERLPLRPARLYDHTAYPFSSTLDIPEVPSLPASISVLAGFRFRKAMGALRDRRGRVRLGVSLPVPVPRAASPVGQDLPSTVRGASDQHRWVGQIARRSLFPHVSLCPESLPGYTEKTAVAT